MSTLGWIAMAVATIVWTVCATVTGIMVARRCLQSFMRGWARMGGRSSKPLRGDVAIAAIWGVAAACVWPLVVVGAALVAAWDLIEDQLDRPADGPVIQMLTGTRQQVREEQHRQREQRIRKLERQLEIGDQ